MRASTTIFIILFSLFLSSAIAAENEKNYQDSLRLKDDGSAEDQARLKKSEALTFKLRQDTIQKTQKLLKKTRSKKVKSQLIYRLSRLLEKQAETLLTISEKKNKLEVYEEKIKQVIRLQERLLQKKYSKYLQKDEIYFYLAENYKKIDNKHKSADYYLKIVNRFKNSIYRIDSLLALGNIHYEWKKFAKARSFYKKILGVKNLVLHPYALYKIAWVFFNQGDEETARKYLIKAIHKSQKIAKKKKVRLDVEEEAMRDLVLFYAENGDPAHAKRFFRKVVSDQQAIELRYQLAKRYYDHGKHNYAYLVATEILDEDKPSLLREGQLLMIKLSIAERVKRRNASVRAAKSLSKWIEKTSPKQAKNEKSKESKKTKEAEKQDEEILAIAEDAEHIIQKLCHRLHFDAQKHKSNKLWKLAEKAYVIYLSTFPKSKNSKEMQFRYAGLLFNLKKFPESYKYANLFLKDADPKQKHFKEAINLRIHSIEKANKQQRKILDNKKLLLAYDEFYKYFKQEKGAEQVAYKAAILAKKVEVPEKAAQRFRMIAKNHPESKLKESAIKESLSTLLKAQKWASLEKESEMLMSMVDAEDKKNTYTQVLDARNTALVKSVEKLEIEKKYKEAKNAYIKLINREDLQKIRALLLVKIANLVERKMRQPLAAIPYWQHLEREFPSSKAGKSAQLEQARIHEKILLPKKAILNYVQYAEQGKSKNHIKSLANAAVLLENIGQWTLAADRFLQLHILQKKEKMDSMQALRISCQNRLLAIQSKANESNYTRLHKCAQTLAKSTSGEESILWQIRNAWALEKIEQYEDSLKEWIAVAKKKHILIKKPELSIYLAHANLRNLRYSLGQYKRIKFSESNENPAANIERKMKYLDRLENIAESVISNGTNRHIYSARQVLHEAYMDFSNTLQSAAMPSKASDEEKKLLQQTFSQVAAEMQKKAKDFKEANKPMKIAKNESKKDLDFDFDTPDSSEAKELMFRAAKQKNDIEAFAKLAWYKFKKGDIGTARYLASKWENALKQKNIEADSPYSSVQLKTFKQLILEKIPEADPVFMEVAKDFS